MDSSQPIVTIPLVTQQREVKYCNDHWAQFIWALRDRQLQEIMENLDGQPEAPHIEGSTILTLAALQFFGAQTIFEQHGGCPACAFENIIDHVADSMAVKNKVTQ